MKPGLRNPESSAGAEAPQVVLLGDFILDVARGTLRMGQNDVDLRPKSFDVLTHLVSNAGRVVSKDELLNQIWPDVFVTEDSLSQCIHDVRRALSDKSHSLIRTISRRGYLISENMIKFGAPPSLDMDIGPGESPVNPESEVPRIAVLPFAYPSEMQDGKYFADGFVEDVVLGLCRVRQLFVIGHLTSLTYGNEVPDPVQAAVDLSVRYVVMGSLRCTDTRLRVMAQLMDTETRAVIWAEKFDTDRNQTFDVQDRIANGIVGELIPRIQSAEIERARRKRPDSLVAYDLYLQALPLVRSMSKDGNIRAIELCNRALELEPDYAVVAGLAAWAYSLRVSQGWEEDPTNDRRLAINLARRAIRLGMVNEDSDALAMAGYVIAYLAEELQEGLSVLQRAITINPNSSQAYAFDGWVRCYCGDAQTAALDFMTALKLSPRDPANFRTHCGLGFAKLLSGDIQAAAAYGREALEINPEFTPAHRLLASALGHLGPDHENEATAVVEALRRLVPGIGITRFSQVTLFKYSGKLDFILDGLRRAGLSE